VSQVVIGQPPWPVRRCNRVHVDRVDVGALLAIDLDRNVTSRSSRPRISSSSNDSSSSVAPVAGRVSRSRAARTAELARGLERLVAPRVPVHRLCACCCRYGLIRGAAVGILGRAVGSRWCAAAIAGRARAPSLDELARVSASELDRAGRGSPGGSRPWFRPRASSSQSSSQLVPGRVARHPRCRSLSRSHADTRRSASASRGSRRRRAGSRARNARPPRGRASLMGTPRVRHHPGLIRPRR